mgnify:CR=1 FL=1
MVRILLVEDNEINQILARRLLDRYLQLTGDYEVIVPIMLAGDCEGGAGGGCPTCG